MRLTAIFGMVYSDRTVVDLQTNSLVPALTLSLIVSELPQIVCMLLWASLTLQHMSTIHSSFSSQLMSYFSSVLIGFADFLLGFH